MELEQLQSEQRRKEAEKSEKEREKRAIEQRLERLQCAKRKVENSKGNIEYIKGKVKDKEKTKDNWKGQKFNQYQSFMSGEFRGAYNTYYSNVDEVLDCICDEITRLENESREVSGLIGFLLNKINNISNEIEKFFN